MASSRKKLDAISGIYKIVSPSGKIYIGQSVHCLKRRNDYKNLFCKNQRKLYNSIKKYGWDTHEFEIINVCLPEELDTFEIYYIELYQTFNSEYGLNLMTGGNKTGTPSPETLILRSEGLKKSWEKRMAEGGFKHSEEALKLISESRKLAWQKQKEDESWASPQEIEKRSKRAKNANHLKVHSQVTKNSMKRGWVKYKQSEEYNSEESKEKRRVINIGKTPWNKGTKGVMKAWNKGTKLTPDQAKKNGEYAKIGWEMRKAKGGKIWSDETLKKRSEAMKRFYDNKKKEVA